MSKIKAVGFDCSLSNLGVASVEIDTDTLDVTVAGLHLIETKPGKDKRVRKSSQDYERAKALRAGFQRHCEGAYIAFAEMPIGSQSARAMASYGVVVGLLASLPVPLIQVSPQEVKIAAVADKTASKEEMINWARQMYPEAGWLRRGGRVIAKNEHMADAIAVVFAGVETEQFQSLLSILKGSAAVAA